MKKFFITACMLPVTLTVALTQQVFPSKLKVFIDCSSAWCDMRYIRSEINVVDFLLDNTAADVHVLITSQGTGSGADQYQLIFFGQKGFKGRVDTLRFNNDPNDVEFEKRDMLLKYLKSGLVPYIIKTGAAKNMVIGLKTSDSSNDKSTDSPGVRDPWNYWVIRFGGDGNMNADANYKNISYSGNASANQITENLKVGIGIYWSRNRADFEYEDSGATQKFVVNNHNWSLNQYMVKTINDHWSWAIEMKFSQNTFSNNKGRALLRPAVEYNIFPYKEVNTKLFTMSYGLTARLNNYYDTTIYNKTREVLYGHRASAYLSLNQKWGNSYAGVYYHNYFHNWKLFNLGVDVYTSVRITGGLSFYVMVFGGLTRDQVFLVKGNATPEEVLAKRRQLASGFNYYSSIGISYRFGSRLNNVVNPRFDRSNSGNDE